MKTDGSLPLLLVISDCPPIPEGIGVASSIVLYRLFSAYPIERIRYIATSTFPKSLISDAPSIRDRLTEIFVLPVAFRGWYLPVAEWVNFVMQPLLAWQIHRLCNTYKPEVIFASPLHQGHLFRAAVKVSRRLNIPLVAYFLDDWARAYELRWPRYSRVGHKWQAQAIDCAAQVYVNGPGMQAEYRRRYRKDSQILTNIVDISSYSSTCSTRPKSQHEMRTIVYTGSVYGAQQDAIANLVRALDILNASQTICCLDLYSGLSAADLAVLGWDRPYVAAKTPVSSRDIPRVLSSADLLFVPLSFRPRWSYTVRTSAPGKLAEYVASGRPIIVHAPPEADISALAIQRGFGLLVDKPDPKLLAQAVRKILHDDKFAGELGRRALEVARQYYDQRTVQSRLYDTLTRIARDSQGCQDADLLEMK